MSNRIIIITTVFFLLTSFVFLSWTQKRQADINTKNLWMLYFQNPKDNSVDFSIENHSQNSKFHWQIFADASLLKEGDIIISQGIIQTVPVQIIEEKKLRKKINIIVSTNNEKKEIYKIY